MHVCTDTMLAGSIRGEKAFNSFQEMAKQLDTWSNVGFFPFCIIHKKGFRDCTEQMIREHCWNHFISTDMSRTLDSSREIEVGELKGRWKIMKKQIMFIYCIWGWGLKTVNCGWVIKGMWWQISWLVICRFSPFLRSVCREIAGRAGVPSAQGFGPFL